MGSEMCIRDSAMTLQGFEAGLPLMPCAEAPEGVKAEVKAEMEKLGLI